MVANTLKWLSQPVASLSLVDENLFHRAIRVYLRHGYSLGVVAE